MIMSATRVTALLTVLLFGSGLALVAGPLTPSPQTGNDPILAAPGVDAAARFSGAGGVTIIESGEEALIDGVPQMRGQVSQLLARLIEADDPRMAGTQTFTQYAADFSSNSYPGFGPTWGEMRIEDDHGAWVGDVAGVWHGGGSELSGWLTGEGAYEGLVEYILFETSGARVEFSGVIYPADVLPLEQEVE